MTILDEDPPKLNINDGWDETFFELIDACLKKNPTQRFVYLNYNKTIGIK
jgi:hypothetical protein